ncbi:MAG: hypothetical protein AMJ91_06805 [candidate division Zixibacteria bacterium SM23_73_3]|nr:MAG: hypothetical protein AMJ91_06805 [candidate division Zixibacteria bacterium SM23_73_3]
MRVRNSISTFSESQNLTSIGRFILSCAALILVALLFLPVLAFAQEDTLILLGTNTDVLNTYAVSAYNKHAFVTGTGLWISVINYSVPTLPTKITQYTGSAYDIEIKDTLAYYVLDNDFGFHIRDISDPLESQVVGSCYGFWHGFRVHLFDTLALLMHRTAIEYCLLEIIDISDPTDPQVLSTIDPPPYGTMHFGDAYKKDNYVYWVDHAYIEEPWEEVGRIIVFDITDPTQPVQIVSDTCLQARPNAIWIKDNYAYVVETFGGRGLVVFDISDPYNIDSVGCFPIPEGGAWNVYIKGSYAYVCTHRLYVLDISDPADPSLVTYYNTPEIPNYVFVDPPYVLVGCYSSFLVFEASFLKDIPGDVNGDGEVDLGDVLFLVSYLYKQGPAPEPIERGDVNGDCVIDLGDVLYLVSYLYKHGPAPQNGCAL